METDKSKNGEKLQKIQLRGNKWLKDRKNKTKRKYEINGRIKFKYYSVITIHVKCLNLLFKRLWNGFWKQTKKSTKCYL